MHVVQLLFMRVFLQTHNLNFQLESLSTERDGLVQQLSDASAQGERLAAENDELARQLSQLQADFDAVGVQMQQLEASLPAAATAPNTGTRRAASSAASQQLAARSASGQSATSPAAAKDSAGPGSLTKIPDVEVAPSSVADANKPAGSGEELSASQGQGFQGFPVPSSAGGTSGVANAFSRNRIISEGGSLEVPVLQEGGPQVRPGAAG